MRWLNMKKFFLGLLIGIVIGTTFGLWWKAKEDKPIIDSKCREVAYWMNEYANSNSRYYDLWNKLSSEERMRFGVPTVGDLIKHEGKPHSELSPLVPPTARDLMKHEIEHDLLK
jgi:gas vesicle protein